MKNINKEIAIEIIHSLGKSKRESLINALKRNQMLTTSRNLENGEMIIYKEGIYLKLSGTRCGFNVYCKDNDGELIPLSRKPHDNNLSFIYKDYIDLNESDFDEIR